MEDSLSILISNPSIKDYGKFKHPIPSVYSRSDVYELPRKYTIRNIALTYDKNPYGFFSQVITYEFYVPFKLVEKYGIIFLTIIYYCDYYCYIFIILIYIIIIIRINNNNYIIIINDINNYSNNINYNNNND